MTIRHIVLMSFPDGAGADYLARLSGGLAELAASVPEIAGASWGADLTNHADNYDYALVFDFADRDAYERYRRHPAHLAFIDRFMRQIPTRKVRVQYEMAVAGAEPAASR